MSKEKLTQKRLKELLIYNPETGIFIRKISRQCVQKGDVAGTTQQGYIRIKVGGRFYFAHRLAWSICDGSSPAFEYVNNMLGD